MEWSVTRNRWDTSTGRSKLIIVAEGEELENRLSPVKSVSRRNKKTLCHDQSNSYRFDGFFGGPVPSVSRKPAVGG
jgi:hypothetical protein